MREIVGSSSFNCYSTGSRSKHRPVYFVCSSRAGKWKMPWRQWAEDDASAGKRDKVKISFCFC